ncbi:hypothetical protein OB13_14370, partial [Pontibacter sp. HJ8]
MAQSAKSTFDPKSLQVAWELVDNNYQNQSQSLSTITLKNTGKAPFPATGWSLYFNGSANIAVREGQAPVRVEHVNGDLLRLIPTENSKSIAAGDSQRIELVGRGRVNSTSNAPVGFYLVWDNAPNKGLPVKSEIRQPDPATVGKINAAGWITPALVYEQNETIADLPAEKLPKVFPTPANYTETGKTFTLTAAIPIVADNAFKREAALLANHLSTVLTKKPVVQTTGKGTAIRLQKKEGLGPEAYELQV